MKYKIKHLYVRKMSQNEGQDIDWNKAERVVFPNLKPTSTSISLRLPQSMLQELKVVANKLDVPYQSLIKMILAERLKFNRRKAA